MSARWMGARAVTVWTLGGFLLGFAFITGFSIGWLVFPFAAAVLLLAIARARVWPEVLTLFAGFGLVALFLGLTNLDYTRCPEMHPSGQGKACGGVNPAISLSIAAICLSLAGVPLLINRSKRGPDTAV